MSRVIALAAFLAIAGWAFGAQDKPPEKPPEKKDEPKKKKELKPCDNKKLEAGFHCEQCQNNLKPDEMSGTNCKVCGKEPKKIEYCVKRGYLPTCGKDECQKSAGSKSGQCKCKKPLEEQVERCKIVFICDGCGLGAFVKGELKHNEETHKDETKKKGERKTCENSGIGLHVGK